MKWLIVIFLSLGMFVAQPGFAKDKTPDVEMDEGDHEDEHEEKKEKHKEEIPEVLDVHERDAEMHRWELNVYYPTFIGDALRTSFVGAGASIDVRLIPLLSIGGDFMWSQAQFDDVGFGATITDRNLYLMMGVLTFNMPAAFLSGNKVVEMDFFNTLGGGIMRVNGDNRVAGFVGGGIKIYPKFAHWLAFRTEARAYFSSINNPAGSNFVNDWTVTIGPTFLLPPKMF